MIAKKAEKAYLLNMKGQSFYFLYSLFFLLLCSIDAAVQAYQPIQWSPLNPYVLKDNDQEGPSTLKVLNPKGELVAMIRYRYNSSGRLIQENYYNAKGLETGRTQYDYRKYLLSGERLIDTSGKVLSSKQFFYDSQGQLQSLKVYDSKKRIRSEQFYHYLQKRLTGGLEVMRDGDNKEQKNKFQIFYERNKPSRILFSAQDVGKILEIIYSYDKMQRIKERTRHLFLEKKISRCIYHYNERGQLESYSYKSKDTKGKWLKDRQIVLSYAKSPSQKGL